MCGSSGRTSAPYWKVAQPSGAHKPSFSGPVHTYRTGGSAIHELRTLRILGSCVGSCISPYWQAAPNARGPEGGDTAVRSDNLIYILVVVILVLVALLLLSRLL
jgi:hypothetical protein